MNLIQLPKRFTFIRGDYILIVGLIFIVLEKYFHRNYPFFYLLLLIAGTFIFAWMETQEEYLKQIAHFYHKYPTITWILRISAIISLFELFLTYR
jgi:hypothetical protein